MPELLDYLDFAKGLSKRAGKLISDNASQALTIEIKSDQSPVTQVDKAINSLVAQAIQETFPSHGLLGEEENLGTGEEPMQWLCDPLDGTKAFIQGIPESMFMLALLDHGDPVLSVVYDPHANKLFHAVKGQGAFCGDVRLRVSNHSIQEGYVSLDNDALDCLPALFEARGKFQQAAATGYKCMLLAKGNIIGYVNRDPDNHDVGPASLIIEEAGGKVTGLDGQPLMFDRKISTVVASNGSCHEQLLAIVNSSQA